MSLLPRRPAALLIASGLLAASPAAAEMFQYVDSQGRLHFTQDLSQVPPEYRDQVERKELKKEISVTGDANAQRPDERLREMETRKRQLERAAQQRARKNTTPAALAPRPDPLVGAPEPRKYDKECDYSDGTRPQRCRKWLTPEWSRWNAANGGDNGKPVTRRSLGDR